MRIVHVFNSSIVSGPETLVLPALPRLGLPVTVVFLVESRRAEESQGPLEYARGLGLDVRTVQVRSRVDWHAVRDLRRDFVEIRPDIIHSHDVKASTYTALAGRGFTLFSTHHGVRGRSGWKAKAYETFYAHVVLRHFDRVLAVCTSDRERLIARGLGRDRVITHLNGVDRPRVDRSEREATALRIRESWGIPTPGPYLGVVGRLAPEKRIDRILTVLAEPSLSNRPWQLLIFGRGPEESRLRAIARSLGVTDRVRWMGYRGTVGQELAGLDVLMSFSDAEGLPINLIEAGWAATPVLATAVDGNLDLIPSRDEGILFPLEQSHAQTARELARLLEDTNAQRRMGERFQERVIRQFSGGHWINRLLELYSHAAQTSVS